MKNTITIVSQVIITYFAARYLTIEHPIWTYIIIVASLAGGLAVILFIPSRSKPAQQQPVPAPEPEYKPTKVYLMQIGAFLDEMRTVSARFTYAWAFFNEWFNGIGVTSGSTLCELQLDEIWIQHFVDDMASLFRKDIAVAHGDVHTRLLCQGHAFLRAIKTKCIAISLDVDGINFDPPISWGEAVMHAQG